MRWYYAVPTLAAALLAAGCTSDKPITPFGPSGRPSFALKNNANVDLDQWANGAGSTAASWQNGDLNGNNSTYAEGKVVPFRLALEGLALSQHNITLQYDWTANGHKAYDFLTNADATEITVFDHICEDGGGGVSSLCGSSTTTMPSGVPKVDIAFTTETFESPTGSGKTVSGAISGSSTAGSRTLRIYGITDATHVSLSAISHTGDANKNSEAQLLVTFTPDVAGPVLLVWGGHLAESGYWDAIPNGSSTIQGAPWHMRTLNLDNGGGANQDRSIQPSAIVPPALSVVKVANPTGPVSAGTDIGFNITVTNGGPGSAFNVTITDPLPSHAGISWSTTTPGCSVSAGSPQVLTCTITTLLATAGSNTFLAQVTSHTTSAACAVITNDGATVTAANIPDDPQHPIVSGSASVTVVCPDLHILKTAKPAGPVSAGDNIGFEIVFSNGAGAGAATNVGFSDPLPNVGGAWTIASQDGTACSITTGTLNCTGINLAAGASYKVSVSATTTAVACGTVSNTATITGTTTSSTATVVVNCPSLSITKTADASPVDAGSQIGFVVTVTNSGAANTGTAKGVTVSDPLPTGTGISWSIATPSTGWSINAGGSLVLASTDLAPGASTSVHIISQTTGNSCATYSNTATASLTNGTAPQPANASVVVRCPTISITKMADSTPVSAGSTIGFTVTVTNTGAAGSATAKGVTVNDPLPTGAAGSGIVWSIATPSTGWSINAGGSLVLGSTDLVPGASTSVHITSPTTKNSCATYSNTATASLTNGTAPEPANASIIVRCPTVSLTKTADSSAAVSAGSQIGFTITVTNTGAPGAATATGVTVSDQLPGGSGITWSIEGTPAPAVGWTLDASGLLKLASTSLSAGQNAHVHVISSTTKESCQKYDNTASATVGNGTAPPNASASQTVNCPNVSLLKTAKAAAVDSGGQIGFDVTVSNSGAAGTGTAKNVNVTDNLPGGSGISWSISPASPGWGIAGVVPNQVLSFTGDLAPGASSVVHVVSSTVGAVCKQYDNTASATVGNGVAPKDASASEIVHCLPNITVTKTIIGGGPTVFDFSQNTTGGTPANLTYTMGNGGSTTTKLLQPGTYKLCEVLLPVGWSSSTFWSTTAQLDGISVSPYNPDADKYPAGQDLGNRCVDVTVTYGDHKTLAWTNRPPPGGDLRTIGYWKNWSSCAGSSGGQYAKAVARNQLYATLDGNLPQTVGLLVLTADKTGCLNAVNILSKQDIKGTKMASDPAYNLAAQLLAALLNKQATSKVCPVGWPRVATAQALLVTIKFNGSGPFAKSMSALQISQANTLAQQIDALNNNIAGYC